MKIVNEDYPLMDNYFMYLGRTSIHTHTYWTDNHPSCLVCQIKWDFYDVKSTDTLENLLDWLKQDHLLEDPTLKRRGDEDYLVFSKTNKNVQFGYDISYKMKMTFAQLNESEMIETGNVIQVLDVNLPTALVVHIWILE